MLRRRKKLTAKGNVFAQSASASNDVVLLTDFTSIRDAFSRFGADDFAILCQNSGPNNKIICSARDGERHAIVALSICM